MTEPIIIYDIEQGTEEWHRVRLGIPTASRFKDVLAEGDGKMRMTYMRELAGERLSGVPAESFSSWAMQRGAEQEDAMRSNFALDNPHLGTLRRVGFVRRGDIGASPDSLIGEDGGLEIKSMRADLLIELAERKDARPPAAHMAQVQGNIFVSGRKWWHLVIGNATMPPNTWVQWTIERNDSYIGKLATELELFCHELKKLTERMRSRR